nr:hypothetical protein [Dulcicalothrix desertica]
MTTYCRDQAREELTLMMGGGALCGVAGGIPVVGAKFFVILTCLIQANFVCSSFIIWVVKLNVIVFPKTDWANFK